MAEADKLNIDSIIQRLLEGKTRVFRSIFIQRGSHFSQQRLGSDSRQRRDGKFISSAASCKRKDLNAPE